MTTADRAMPVGQALLSGLAAGALLAALHLHSHFMGQAAVRALVGVVSAAWLLLRASARR